MLYNKVALKGNTRLTTGQKNNSRLNEQSAVRGKCVWRHFFKTKKVLERIKMWTVCPYVAAWTMCDHTLVYTCPTHFKYTLTVCCYVLFNGTII